MSEISITQLGSNNKTEKFDPTNPEFVKKHNIEPLLSYEELCNKSKDELNNLLNEKIELMRSKNATLIGMMILNYQIEIISDAIDS